MQAEPSVRLFIADVISPERHRNSLPFRTLDISRFMFPIISHWRYRRRWSCSPRQMWRR